MRGPWAWLRKGPDLPLRHPSPFAPVLPGGLPITSGGWRIQSAVGHLVPHGTISTEIADGIWLDLGRDTATLWLRSHRPCPPATLRRAFDDLVLPRLRAASGDLVLHCGIVATPEGAVGLIGPSRAGKSTLAASLATKGASLITDDAAVVSCSASRCSAERLTAGLALFPDSLHALAIDGQRATSGRGPRAKRRLTLPPGPDSAPLAALFRLADPAPAIRAVRLSPAAACMAILANAFALDPGDPAESRHRFARAAAAASRLPVLDLHYPRDYAALPAVHAAIFDALATVSPAGRAA